MTSRSLHYSPPPHHSLCMLLRPAHPSNIQTKLTKRSFGTDKEEIDKSLFTEEIKIKMPDMGEGKILTWYKEEGDIVHRGDVLCDIETADFTFGMETDDEQLGIMGSILVPAPSEMIKDEKTICILLHKPSHRDD